LRTHKLKKYYVAISLITGPPKVGRFVRCERIGEKAFIHIKNGREKSIPVNNIAFIEFYTEEPKIRKQHEFGMPLIKHSLCDFPKPFITENGELDVIFVYGTSALDYADYISYMEQKDEVYEVRSSYQRFDDFGYLLSLAARFGYECNRSGGEIPDIPCGKQDFLLTDEEKKRHNLITIGSGYTNQPISDSFHISCQYES